MADVFDNSEEKKAQIAEIAETQQKAILCQGRPIGMYWFLDNGGKPNNQHIEYPCSVYSLLFTSSKRVCLYEKTLDNGGKQWQLLGNGDYKLTKNKDAVQKLRHNYHYYKFLGLDLNCNRLKYSMTIDLNKFKKIEYIFLLKEIKSVLA